MLPRACFPDRYSSSVTAFDGWLILRWMRCHSLARRSARSAASDCSFVLSSIFLRTASSNFAVVVVSKFLALCTLILSFSAMSSARFCCFRCSPAAFSFAVSVRPSFVLEGIIRIVRRGGARIGSTPSFPFPDPGVATFFTGLFPDWAVLCRLLPERSRFRSEVEFSVSRSDLAAEALAAAVARCPRVVTST